MIVDTMYTVAEGDTLSKIANENNTTVAEIIELNNLDNPNEIVVGDILILLPADDVKTEETEYTYYGTDESVNAYSLTEAEKTLLAQLVYSEANNQSTAGKEAVVHVILNRLNNADFPDAVTEIIMEKGQFDNSSTVPSLPVTDENMLAVENALNSADNTTGALFFWNPNLSNSTYMASLTVVAVIGDHEFMIAS